MPIIVIIIRHVAGVIVFTACDTDEAFSKSLYLRDISCFNTDSVLLQYGAEIESAHHHRAPRDISAHASGGLQQARGHSYRYECAYVFM